MRGEVISLDASLGGGLISGDDGARYAFSADAARGSIRIGDRVDFLGLDGVARDVLPLAAGASAPYAQSAYSAPAGAAYDFGWSMFSFEGRLRRSHFWINWAILFVVGMLFGWIPLIGMLIGLIALWPNIAITVKRLHDMGHSGWLVLAPFVANIALFIVAFMSIGMSAIMNAEALEREDPSAVLGLIGPIFGVIILGFLINIGWLIWIGAVDSQPGRNRFGPNPKYPDQDAAAF